MLGVRLGLRGSRTRVVVMGVAMAFAVAFLLAVLGALPARQAKLDRLADRQPVPVGTLAAAGRTAPPHAPGLAELASTWRGRAVTGWEVVGGAGASVLPPGVDRLPAPGEVLASADLARALRGPHAAELAPRLPGRLVGEVGAAGLSGPHELFAYVGVARPSSGEPARQVLRFGYRERSAPVPLDLRVAARLGAVGLLLPVLVLVATATRLSAATRDRRLAAVRLVGGTTRQVALLVSGEALLSGGVGSGVGLAVFLALRPVAAALVPVEGGVFAGDLMPPATQLVAVLVLVPLLAAVVSLLAMRRVVVDPLGVRRRSRTRGRAGWWRLAPLALGLALLGALWSRHRDLAGPDVTLLLAGGALTVVGLAVVAPAVSRLAGVALVRLPGTAARLAGRRLLADPSATARTLTGTVLVVFVGTWLLAFLPVLSASQSSDAQSLARVLPGSTMLLELGRPLSPAGERALRGLAGVRLVVPVGSAELAPQGARSLDAAMSAGTLSQAAVVRCADLATLLRRDLRCGTALAFAVVARGTAPAAYGPVPAGRLVAMGGDGRARGTVVVPAARPLDVGDQAAALLQASSVLDPSLLPSGAAAAFGARVVVATDGRAATTERVRNALLAQGVPGAQTLREQLAGEQRTVLGYDRAARLGLLLAVLVGSVGLLVTSLDALRARRRDLAALAALGVPVPVVRRALLLEVLAPLLGCTLLALATGAFAAAAYLSADTFYRDRVGLPWRTWGAVGGTALLVVLGVTSLTLLVARGATRPEHLRTE